MAFHILKCMVLVSLVAAAFSSDYGQLSERNGGRKTKSLFVLLADFVDWISWLLQSIFSICYFVFNTIAQTIAEIISTIVSIPQKLINLVEFVGYCVRFSLQANYNFVSSVISIIRRFVENCFIFMKDMIISTLQTFKSLFNMILQLFHNAVNSFPKLFGFAEVGVQTSANAVGSLAFKTNSSFRAVLASIGAVLELFGRSIVTTLMVIADLITHLLLSCAKFFQFIGRTIISLVVGLYRGIVSTCQEIGRAVNAFTWYSIDNFNFLCRQTVQYTQNGFHLIARWFVNLGVLVINCCSFVCEGFKHVVLHSFKYTQNLVIRAIQSLKQSHVRSLAMTVNNTMKEGDVLFAVLLLALAVCLLFIVLKIHVINAGFVFLETKLQGAMMRFIATTHNEPISSHRQRSHDMAVDAPPGDVEHLQKQLQHERDKNICVICQDQPKKVLLLPCRHMCICLPCANYITSSFQRHRRACPLCRSRIDSTVEVYS